MMYFNKYYNNYYLNNIRYIYIYMKQISEKKTLSQFVQGLYIRL